MPGTLKRVHQRLVLTFIAGVLRLSHQPLGLLDDSLWKRHIVLTRVLDLRSLGHDLLDRTDLAPFSIRQDLSVSKCLCVRGLLGCGNMLSYASHKR